MAIKRRSIVVSHCVTP